MWIAPSREKRSHIIDPVKLLFIPLLMFSSAVLISCDDTETYAEKREKEIAAINQFIVDQNINVISESEFFANDSITDLSENEYVLFNSSGVYMQIVRKGCGAKIRNGETCTVLCRFTETNLLTDSIILSNDVLAYAYLVDKMTVKRSSGTFRGSFDSSSSLMYQAYSSTAVPSGWLIPFAYINIGRQDSSDSEIAKVNLIVPHSQGQAYASTYVYPCFYTITYERGL